MATKRCKMSQRIVMTLKRMMPWMKTRKRWMELAMMKNLRRKVLPKVKRRPVPPPPFRNLLMHPSSSTAQGQ